jgi:hypothetical protein
MHRVSRAGARDAVTHADVGDSIAHRNHVSGAAVADRLRLVQTRAHRLQIVEARPSRRSLASTSRTRSGRAFALASKPLLANSADARSVPAETREATTRTSTQPGSSCGAGTSATFNYARARVL